MWTCWCAHWSLTPCWYHAHAVAASALHDCAHAAALSLEPLQAPLEPLQACCGAGRASAEPLQACCGAGRASAGPCLGLDLPLPGRASAGPPASTISLVRLVAAFRLTETSVSGPSGGSPSVLGGSPALARMNSSAMLHAFSIPEAGPDSVSPRFPPHWTLPRMPAEQPVLSKISSRCHLVRVPLS